MNETVQLPLRRIEVGVTFRRIFFFWRFMPNKHPLKTRYVVAISFLAAFIVNLFMPSLWEILIVSNPQLLGNLILLFAMVVCATIIGLLTYKRQRKNWPNFSIEVSCMSYRPRRSSQYKILPKRPSVKALRIHSKRSKTARAIDESLRAPIAESEEQWENNPNRYDLPNVDTPRRRAWFLMDKKENKQNYDLNVTLSVKKENGVTVEATANCGDWNHVQRFINDFESNLLKDRNGKPTQHQDRS